MTATLGRMRGSVMWSIMSLRFAPSMAADSYSVGLMPAMAAK